MGMRPTTGSFPRQRERVDHRTRPGIAMEVVEHPQHRLRVRPRRRGVLRPRAGLAGHRVRHDAPPGGAGRSSGRLVPQPQPPAEVSRFDPRRLIPPDVDGPPEPEPAQQVHRIRPLRRSRTTRGLQLAQERHHRADRLAVAVDQPNRLPQIIARLHRTGRRHHQHGQITIFVDHGRGT
jgi:hypothetical protein